MFCGVNWVSATFKSSPKEIAAVVLLLSVYFSPLSPRDQRAGSASQAPAEQFWEIGILFEVTAVDGTGNGAGASPAAGSHPQALPVLGCELGIMGLHTVASLTSVISVHFEDYYL